MSCRCPADFFDGLHCRYPTGIHQYSSTNDPAALSCGSSLVSSLTPASDWGLREGPKLMGVQADDPDDGDAFYSTGDTLTLTFDAPTDNAGFEAGKLINSTQAHHNSHLPISTQHAAQL